eukprot:scaffold13695_cov93-Cylindrotheca_fusiformis.AAC.1
MGVNGAGAGGNETRRRGSTSEVEESSYPMEVWRRLFAPLDGRDHLFVDAWFPVLSLATTPGMKPPLHNNGPKEERTFCAHALIRSGSVLAVTF